LQNVNAEHGLTAALGTNGYFLLGVLFFTLMCVMLYRIGSRRA
jgi:hypothetical protein